MLEDGIWCCIALTRFSYDTIPYVAIQHRNVISGLFEMTCPGLCHSQPVRFGHLHLTFMPSKSLNINLDVQGKKQGIETLCIFFHVETIP